jgi:RimJ/RimL family protein N-acetyltransferase
VAATEVCLTERLDLRPIAGSDLGDLHRIRRDPRNRVYIPAGPDEGLDATSAWIERFGARWQTNAVGFWTVRLRATGRVVGVGGIDRRAAFWNLYYVIDVDHQGLGYATELARAACRMAGALDPSLPLVAWIHAQNDASQSVARHLGLRDYGLRERDRWNGQPMHLWSGREPPG